MQAFRSTVSSTSRILNSRSIVQSANSRVAGSRSSSRTPAASLNEPLMTKDVNMASDCASAVAKTRFHPSFDSTGAPRRQAVFAGSDPLALIKAMVPLEVRACSDKGEGIWKLTALIVSCQLAVLRCGAL